MVGSEEVSVIRPRPKQPAIADPDLDSRSSSLLTPPHLLCLSLSHKNHEGLVRPSNHGGCCYPYAANFPCEIEAKEQIPSRPPAKMGVKSTNMCSLAGEQHVGLPVGNLLFNDHP